MELSENKEHYLTFVAAQQTQLPIYFYKEWLDLLYQDQWTAYVIKIEGAVIAVFPFPIKKKFGLPIIVSHVFSQYNGLFIDPVYSRHIPKSIALLDKIFSKFYYINFSLHHSLTEVIHWSWKDYYIRNRLTFIILSSNYLDVYKNYKKGLRSDLKIAQKALITQKSENVEDFLPLLNQNNFFIHSKFGDPKLFLAKMLHLSFVQATKAVDSAGNIHAILISLEDSNTVYNLINARKKDSIKGAISLLIDARIQETLMANKNFDFEGSSIKSIYDFFKSFGGSPVIYPNLIKTKFKVSDAIMKTFNLY
jgi:hypothetical protein